MIFLDFELYVKTTTALISNVHKKAFIGAGKVNGTLTTVLEIKFQSVVGRNNIPESAFTSPPLTTSGKTNDDHLFYESIVHFLIASVEKNEENTIVREQLKKHLDKCNHQFELIIRNSVKLRK